MAAIANEDHKTNQMLNPAEVNAVFISLDVFVHEFEGCFDVSFLCLVFS